MYNSQYHQPVFNEQLIGFYFDKKSCIIIIIITERIVLPLPLDNADLLCYSLTKLFLFKILDDEDVKEASLRAFSRGLLTGCLHEGRKILPTGRF